MKKLVFPVLMLVLLGGQAQAQARKAPKAVAPAKTEAASNTGLAIGADIPMAGIMMMGSDGQPVNLEQAKTEKGLVVMFSCNTCPFVIKAQPRTKAAIEVAKKLGFGMVIINSNQAQRDSLDSRGMMQKYANAQSYSVPYVMDEMSQVADAFGATRTPEVFLFDGEGHLVYKGALEDNPSDPAKSTKVYLEDAMKAQAAGQPIRTAQTKSIGCSIKRMQS